MKKKKRTYIIAACMIMTVLILMIVDHILSKEPQYPVAENLIEEFVKENKVNKKDYTDELKAMLEKNPETEEFVLNYPLKKDKHEDFSLDEYKNCTAVPHLLQWDMRWGYEEYAGSIIGMAGCGPVCLSMVAIYLTGDITPDPLYVAHFAEENGYAQKNNGTAWTLMSEGAEKLGLTSTELPLHKESIINALNEGKPVICIMGEGDFTSSGHYIVLTDYSEDGFSVLDPNSKARSLQKWTYEKIEGQIKNIWTFSKS